MSGQKNCPRCGYGMYRITRAWICSKCFWIKDSD